MGIKFDLDKQLQFLNPSMVKNNFNGEQIVFTEAKPSGYAELKVETELPSIFIDNADTIDISFMKADKKKCADSILIQKNNHDQWILRIIEFKRTLNLENLVEIREQIRNAIFKALLLKGCLGIEAFTSIEAYCGFREDKTKNIKKNPVLLKGIREPWKVQALNEWSDCRFFIRDMGIEILMVGIPLDMQSGCGEVKW